MTRNNGPWTHTSGDSYMYQLSLVVAIASISFCSFIHLFLFAGCGLHFSPRFMRGKHRLGSILNGLEPPEVTDDIAQQVLAPYSMLGKVNR